MTTTMYVPIVSTMWERDSTPALRVVKPTLEAAKAVLDAEVRRAGRAPLKWVDQFGGSETFVGDLRYEVLPIEVDLEAWVKVNRSLL